MVDGGPSAKQLRKIIEDLPEQVRGRLNASAELRGMSLDQLVLRLLTEIGGSDAMIANILDDEI